MRRTLPDGLNGNGKQSQAEYIGHELPNFGINAKTTQRIDEGIAESEPSNKKDYAVAVKAGGGAVDWHDARGIIAGGKQKLKLSRCKFGYQCGDQEDHYHILHRFGPV